MKSIKTTAPLFALFVSVILCCLMITSVSAYTVTADLFSGAKNADSDISILEPSNEYGQWCSSVSQKSVMLDYSKHNVFGAYRLMFLFKNKDAIGTNYWVTATFKTDTTEKAQLVYASNAGAYALQPLWGVNLVTLCDDVSVSGGKWVTTEPFCINIPDSQIPTRLNSSLHNTLYFTIQENDAVVYVKEMSFFESKKAAEAYKEKLDAELNGPNASQGSDEALDLSPIILDASTPESAKTIGYDNTEAVYDSTEGAFRAKYFGDGENNAVNYSYNRVYPYGLNFHLTDQSRLTSEHKYICVTYKTDCDGAYSLLLTNYNWKKSVKLTDNISVSANEYVTTAPTLIPDDLFGYIRGGADTWVAADTLNRNVNLYIRGIAFFTSEEQAMEYYNMTAAVEDTDISITVEGTPISEYTIIVPAGDEKALKGTVKTVKNAIQKVTGKTVEVKPDTEPASANEILIGATNRPESALLYDAVSGKFGSGELLTLDFCALTANGKLVIGADLYAVLEQTVVQFADAYLAKRDYNFKNGFEVSCVVDDRNSNGNYFEYATFTEIEKSFETPNTYSDNFEGEAVGKDPDYWVEDPIDASSISAVIGEDEIYHKVDFSSFNDFSKTARINPDVLSSAETKADTGLYSAWIGAHQFEDGHVKVLPRDGMTVGGYYRLAFIPAEKVVSSDYKYMCVTYKVDAPEGVKGALELRMNNSVIVLDNELASTGGEYITSAPVDISTDSYIFPRWSGSTVHNAICFNFGDVSKDIDIYVKEVTFFSDDEDAEKYIAGTLEPVQSSGSAAFGETFGKKVDFTSFSSFASTARINPDVLSSDETKEDAGLYSAWIGAHQFEDGHVKVLPRGGMTVGGYYRLAFIPGNNVVSNNYKYMCVTYKVDAPEGVKGALELRMNNSVIVLDSELTSTGGEYVTSAPVDISTDSYIFPRWSGSTVHNAICFNFGDLSKDIDIYVKEVTFFPDVDVAEQYIAGEITELTPKSAPTEVADDWKIAADGENTVYAAKADNRTFSWLHTFERDIQLTAKMKLTATGANAKAGLVCRINDDLAYVLAGYDAANGKWFIESRQGDPYMPHRTYGTASTVELGKWYTLKLVAEGSKIALYVDGGTTPVVITETVTHLSPGKVGLFAQDSEVMFDDADLILTSCQSRVENSVITMTLPIADFTEGGTVLPINDGELLFLHQSNQLISYDMGLSWQSTYWANIVQHANVYRLASGKIIRLEEITKDGIRYYAASHSSDEGATWSSPVVIAPFKFNTNTGSSCIMNDKFMQMSDGRLFFSCTYNNVNGRTAHVEIYYSDDEGYTWTKSQTSSLDITADTHFGESKIVETSNGTLRMLTTWSQKPCMTYSESFDNGVTWSELVLMEDFDCSISSSDVFKDPETGIYYLVWVYNKYNGGMPRARLSLAMSSDGINWQYCMDVDRWDSPITHQGGTLAHIVDPFVKVVGDYVFVGTGFSETLGDYKNQYHKGQAERIYRIDKDLITPYSVWPSTVGIE